MGGGILKTMDHVAIMSKSFGDLIAKILSGEKRIESRWSINKIAPWNRVKRSDKVFFKNAGEKVTAVAEVEKVMQFEKLTLEKSNEIIKRYGRVLCLDRTPEKKNYCILMWLKNPRKVEPFAVDKTGFGSAAAWMCVGGIGKVKI